MMGGREVGGPGRWRGLRIRRVGVMGSFEGLSGGLAVFRRTFRGSWGLSKDVQGSWGLSKHLFGVTGSGEVFRRIHWSHGVF